jgi:hypothetical protein
LQTYTSRILAKSLAASVRHVPRTNIRPFYTFNITVAAPPLVERERRTDRGGGAVGIRKAEPLPDKITNDKFHETSLLVCHFTRTSVACVRLYAYDLAKLARIEEDCTTTYFIAKQITTIDTPIVILQL